MNRWVLICFWSLLIGAHAACLCSTDADLLRRWQERVEKKPFYLSRFLSLLVLALAVWQLIFLLEGASR